MCACMCVCAEVGPIIVTLHAQSDVIMSGFCLEPIFDLLTEPFSGKIKLLFPHEFLDSCFTYIPLP